MVKINITSFSALIIAFFMLGSTANAQKIWGTGAAVGASDGEFANPFVETGSYAPGDNINAWTALSVNDKNGTPGAAYWIQSTLGRSQGAYIGSNPSTCNSPTMANGIAIFDSDFLDNAGTPVDQGGANTGTSGARHRGELISPRIDLTGNTNKALIVEFFTWYRNYDAVMQVGLSVDDGVTWTDMDIKAAVPNATRGTARILFSNATAGIANLSECRLRFVFDGEYYFLTVDDVSIQVAPDYDIAMGTPNTAVNNIGNNGDNVKVGCHRYVALENLDPTDLREWFFGGRVVNLGGSNILPAANPRLHINIDYEHAVTGAIERNVYRDSLDLDTIVAGSAEGLIEMGFLDNIDFIMNRPEGGNYYVSYWASHDSTDGNISNDSAFHVFTVTTKDSSKSAYISNVNLARDGSVGVTSSTFPGGGNGFKSWEFGSVYYFPRGERDTLVLDSLSFAYYLTRGFVGDSSQTLLCNVYKVDATSAGGTLNDKALLTPISTAFVSLTGLGGSGTAAGEYGRATVSDFREPAQGQPMRRLEDNAFYYISIETKADLANGGVAFGSDDVPWIGSARNINYYMNILYTGTDSLINPSPVGTKDAADTDSWNWIGFGADVIPSIGLYISKSHGHNAVTTVWDTEGAELNVYPNPASEVMNVEFTLENAADVTYIITDMTGRVVSVTQSKNVTSDVKQVNVGQMPSGVYMITAKTEAGTSTKRFVVE